MTEARRIYWTICAGVFVVGVLAVVTTPWPDYTFNLTNNLPGTLYVIYKGGEVKKGELTTYRWHGGATYSAGTTFIKRVAGVADDMVEWTDDASWMNDQYIDTAKPFSKAGVPLQPAQEDAIGAGEYFVSTSNPSSLGS